MNMASILTTGVDKIVGKTGRSALRVVNYLINYSSFVALLMRDWISGFSVRKSQMRSAIVPQILFSGVDGLPIICILSFILGFTIIFRLIELMGGLAQSDELISLLVNLIGMEFAPLICAIILIGRSGSAIAVDIGNMKILHEIQSLEILGININEVLVVPRVIALAIAQTILALTFTILSISSGIIISGWLISVSRFDLIYHVMDAFEFYHIALFSVKNLLFGAVIGSVACYHGLQVHIVPSEVPQQTQRTIVNSMLLIFLIDTLFALLL